MTGITESTPIASRSRQQFSSWSISAMSAIEQPAARSGRITFWCGAQSTSALSAMKCTPQKTTNSASGRVPQYRDSLNESPT